jgi:hypothetical protein
MCVWLSSDAMEEGEMMHRRRTILSIVLMLLVGCSATPPSMDAVRNEIIPLPAFAASVYEEYTNGFDTHTIITTYTTTRSTMEVFAYYETLFTEQGWTNETPPGPVAPEGLRFEKGAQEGDRPGDRVLFRTIYLSVQDCGDARCVRLQDVTTSGVRSDGFN